ncbi:MAG: UbiA family prenyltransferase [Sedimentisphaerales bacterium]|nr:UbiA family prenyltransferase [Sedimentisphaerales bacterium]
MLSSTLVDGKTAGLRERDITLTQFIHFFRMIRFSHTVFALPFALLGAFLAADGGKGGFPGWGKLGLIVWCMVCARSTAMVFNRIADRHIDARNPRTAGRELPTGKLTPQQANWFLWICALGFGIGCALFKYRLGPWFGYGNIWPMIFSAPVLVFICLYSLSKRFTSASHFWLGTALCLAPVSAWAAVSPPDGPVVAWPGIVLGLAVLFWTAGFDIIYALQDVEVDRREGLYSLPARFGVAEALWTSRLCHSLTITCLLLLVRLTALGMLFAAAVIVTAGLLLIEHSLVRGGRTGRIALAFGTINGIISILLAATGIIDLLWNPSGP